MKFRRVFLFVLILLVFFQICTGQENAEAQPTENWLKEFINYQAPFLDYRYDRYSKEDIVKFREKLDLLKNAKFEDEWEGIYFQDNEETGFSQLRWSSSLGFLSFYIYTCHPELRFINYGRVINLPDSMQIIPEFAENSPRTSASVNYVKVKWNDRHYLVEESSLSAFAEKAAGIYVEPEDSSNDSYAKWLNYWVNGDMEKDLTGLPQFPAKYKKLERSPIETKIISVGKRRIEAEIALQTISFTAESAIYPIIVAAGKNKGVKLGMKFINAETKEEIFITQVLANSSTGVIVRAIDDNKNDHCLNDKGEKISCPSIRTSQKVATPIGKFWW